MRHILLFLLSLISTLPGIASNIETRAGELYRSGENKFLACNYPAAVCDFESALKLYQTNREKNAVYILNTQAYLANTYWNSGKGQKAENLAKICYDQLTRFPDPENPGLIDAYLLLAEFYLSFDISFEINDFLIEKAGKIISENYQHDNRITGIFYSIKGYSDLLRDDSYNAQHYLERSGEILGKIPDLKRYRSLNDVYMAHAKFENGSANEAIQFANHCLSRDDLSFEGRLLLLQAINWVYFSTDDTAKFYESSNRLIKAASEDDEKERPVGTKILVLTRAHRYLGVFKDVSDERLFHYKNAIATYQNLSDRGKEIALLYYRLGWIHFYKEDFETALRYVHKSIIASSYEYNDTSLLANPPLEKLMNHGNIIDFLFLKGTILTWSTPIDKSYIRLALQCYEMAYSFLDRRLNKVDMENSLLNVLDYQQYLLGHVVTHANYLYRYKGEEEYARKAFYYSEKGKVRVLKMFTGKSEILKSCGVPDSIIERSNRLGADILQTENMIALMQTKGDDNSELIRKLNFLSDQRDFLNYEIERNYPLYQKSGNYPAIPEVEEIQSVLQPDQALVEYHMTKGQIIIFVITKTGFYQHYQPITTDTHFHFKNLRQLVSSAPFGDHTDSTFQSFVKSSAHLYDMLIRPVYHKIKGKRLIIVPQDQMTTIPFEVLISEEYTGRSDYSKLNWLIREFPVMYAFSASYLIDKKKENFGSGMAAFMPVYQKTDTISSLEGASNEVRYLRNKLNFTLFKGQRSDEYTFRKKSHRFGIIHIAAHTLTNDERPDLSCFIFNRAADDSDDGRLHAFEIKQLKLNAQMVVLNGCNTGYGSLKRGEGMVSLARSFFFTGIRTVAYTLWPVADRAARDLITGFYKEIYKQEPPDIAMMKSKFAFIKNSDPVKAHPYYWAGFIVSGKSQIIPRKPDYIKPAAIVLLLLALIAGYKTLRDSKLT